MNCHNGEKYLEEAINSVLEQTYSNWELIIWDNCSTDLTSSISKSYNDSRIKYFFSEKFMKLGEARNLAIKQSSGEFIGFLDCDDLYLKEKLKLQISEFKNERVGIVISNSLFFKNNGRSKKLYNKKKPPTGLVFSELLSSYFISLETVVIRKEALKSLDYWFDTQFQVIEEYDLLVRIGYAWEVAYVDQVLAKWRVHNSSWTWTKSELFPFEKKIMLMNLKNSINDFEKIYSNEINQIHQEIAIEESIMNWKNGDNLLARKKIKPFLKLNLKLHFFHLLTFFPFTIFILFEKLRGGIRPD